MSKKLDLEAIFTAVAKDRNTESSAKAGDRRQRIENLEFWRRMPMSRALEERVLVAMICDPAVLSLCDDVETGDFATPRLMTVFTALRCLQADGTWAAGTVYEAIYWLGDHLAREDAAKGTRKREIIDDIYLGQLICDHMYETYGPFGSPDAEWVRHDVDRLRRLADRRREILLES